MEASGRRLVEILMDALRPEEVVLGGGNVKKLKELPYIAGQAKTPTHSGEGFAFGKSAAPADTREFGLHEHACRKRAHQR